MVPANPCCCSSSTPSSSGGGLPVCCSGLADRVLHISWSGAMFLDGFPDPQCEGSGTGVSAICTTIGALYGGDHAGFPADKQVVAITISGHSGIWVDAPLSCDPIHYVGEACVLVDPPPASDPCDSTHWFGGAVRPCSYFSFFTYAKFSVEVTE